MTYIELVQEVRKLSPDERHALLDILQNEFVHEQTPSRTLLDYYGIAAHLADAIDPQIYVHQLRDEWDKRP